MCVSLFCCRRRGGEGGESWSALEIGSSSHLEQRLVPLFRSSPFHFWASSLANQADFKGKPRGDRDEQATHFGSRRRERELERNVEISLQFFKKIQGRKKQGKGKNAL